MLHTYDPAFVQWGAPVPDPVAARRAGGRRRYNAWRTFCRTYRRLQITQLLQTGQYGGLVEYGTQARLAAALGVSRATICRDMAALLAAVNRPAPNIPKNLHKLTPDRP